MTRIEIESLKKDLLYMSVDGVIFNETILKKVKGLNLTSEERKELIDFLNDNKIKIVKTESLNFTDTTDNLPENSIKQYIQEISNFPVLTKEEEIELFKRLENGEDVFEQICNANLKLVVYVAKKYPTSTNMSFLDIVQEGNKALIESIKRFDYKKGFKFSSYAIWLIHKYISRAIHEKDRLIRLPEHHVIFIAEYRKLKNENLSDQEIIDILEITKEFLDHIKIYNQPIKSLSTAPTIDHDPLIDIIKDDTVNVESVYEKESLQEEIKSIIQQLLSELKPEHADILIKRYGLNGEEKCTFEELSEFLKTTRQNINQKEQRLIENIRTKKCFQNFRKSIGEYYE